jgi:hypothetical protein
MRAKIHRLTSAGSGKVDASDYGPEQVLNSEAKTGMRPISRRAYKKGGKVVASSGADAPQNAGKKPRSGNKHLTVDALVNRNLKDANEDREGKKHIGGLKNGGRAKAFEGSAKDEKQDKKLAKKYGMSMESWEKSKMDDKHDSQKSMKGLKEGGRTGKKLGGILKDATKYGALGLGIGALAGGNPGAAGALGGLAGLGAHFLGKKKDGAAPAPAVAGKKEGGGLYANIHAKRERIADGSKERMRKAGSKGAPTEEAFKKSARTAKAYGGNLSSLEMNKGGRAKRAGGGYNGPDPAASAESAARMAEQERLEREFMDRMDRQEKMPPRPKPKPPAKRMPPPTYQMPDRVPSDDYSKGGRTVFDVEKGSTTVRNPNADYERAGSYGGHQIWRSKSDPKQHLVVRGDNTVHSMMDGDTAGVKRALRDFGLDTLSYKEGDDERAERKAGGRTKGKTNINIVIATGKGQQDGQPDMPPMPSPQGVPVQMPPPPPPPQAAAPMPMPMPMPMPPAGGPGPGPAPMPRKAGGRTYRSYKDMDAGAGSGLGRSEKTEIQKHKK